MSKQSTNDIFSQTQVNIAQSCSRVLNAWNDFLDKYLKSKEWRQALAIKNKALRSERSLRSVFYKFYYSPYHRKCYKDAPPIYFTAVIPPQMRPHLVQQIFTLCEHLKVHSSLIIMKLD